MPAASHRRAAGAAAGPRRLQGSVGAAAGGPSVACISDRNVPPTIVLTNAAPRIPRERRTMSLRTRKIARTRSVT